MGTTSVVAALNMQRQKGGQAPIVIKILLDRQLVHQEATGLKTDPKHWDTGSRQLLKSYPNSTLVNQKVKKRINELEAAILQKELLGASITKTLVKQLATGNDPGRDFYKWCEAWLTEKYSKSETLRTYKSELSKLKQYREALYFGDFNLAFFTSYKKYMLETLGNSDNTVWKTFKFINTMLNDAVKIGGMLAENPMKGFNRGKYENPTKTGLNFEECKTIEPYCTDENQPVLLRIVATRFMLMCYSGLRFEDAMAFDPAVHIIEGQTLQMKTRKQGVVVSLKLNDYLRPIINRIATQPKCKFTNKKYNEHLRTVAALAGVHRVPLSAHVGRHTFGTLLAELEVPEEQAKELLGHKDIRSTRVYYHVSDQALGRAMEKFNSR